MPVHDIGNVRFKKFRAGDFIPPYRPVHTVDCYPPAPGSIKDHNPPSTYNPVILPDYLQNAEIKRIQEGAAAGATPAPDFPDIWAGAMQGLDITPLNIDVSKVPAAWLRVTRCKVHEIYYEVAHKVWQIVVAARQRITLDGVVYPKGDAVGAFRICEPHEYRFVKRTVHSERCCPDTPDPGVSEDQSQWWPERLTFTEWGMYLKPYHDPWRLRLGAQFQYWDHELDWGED